MYIYRNLESYLGKCENCGECCASPGLLLPEQVKGIAEHLRLSQEELFERHLIVQVSAPTVFLPPVFMLSPVKADRDGRRAPQRVYDAAYGNLSGCSCIFWDESGRRCRIHEVRPFECALALCAKMTGDVPVFLDRQYYYHRWRDSQELVYSLFPGLRAAHGKLKESVEAMYQSFEEANRIMCTEMATVLGGNPVRGVPLYS